MTEREQSILRLLPTPTLETGEIASELGIAISTLRTHIKNIYGKRGCKAAYS